ncbi:MAG: hypothetical protein IAE78_08060 [Myxococcus sp.]|nr:hypothetical protein [Myxococcus sp.]
MGAFSFTVAVALALAPDDFDAERAAAIEREQAKQTAAVEAKYGNKKSTELTREERAQMIRDQAAAQNQVLEKYGISAKEWGRAQMNRSREQVEQVKQAARALEAREQAAAQKARAESASEPKEIVIQKGISEDNPVTLEERQGETPAVEKGLPSDYERDQSAAADSDAVNKTEAGPAPKGKGGKK